MNDKNRPFLAVLFYWVFFVWELLGKLTSYAKRVHVGIKFACGRVLKGPTPVKPIIVLNGDDHPEVSKVIVATKNFIRVREIVKHLIQHHGVKLRGAFPCFRVGANEPTGRVHMLGNVNGASISVNSCVVVTVDKPAQQAISAANVQHALAVLQQFGNKLVSRCLVFVISTVKKRLGVGGCGRSHAALYGFIALLSIGQTLTGATYYVNATGGDDSRNTTQAQSPATPWLTITKGRQNAIAGDTVKVANGTYEERVLIFSTNSGTAGNHVNFLGNSTGTGVVMRGFTITAVHDVRILGFEITHVTTANDDGIRLTGTCSNIVIMDNYIHEVHERAIGVASGSYVSFLTIRGNVIYYIAHPGSLQVSDVAIGGSPATARGSRWLVEYNDIQRSGDYLYLFGTNMIARNNRFNDTDTSYWITNGMHWDGFQPGSDGADAGMRNHLVERHLITNIRDHHEETPGEKDGHAGIWHDSVGAGDAGALLRGNVVDRMSSGGFAQIGTDSFRTYNNTFLRTPVDINTGTLTFYAQTFTNGLIANTVMAHHHSPGSTNVTSIGIDVGTAVVTNNWGFLSGVEPSYIGTTNPQFVDTNNNDFRLGASSPLINVGTTNVGWITSASASGTVFDVNDGGLFCDGWNVCEGDIVTINGTTTRIVGITNVTIGVAASVTWTQNDSIHWGHQNRPEIGAYPDDAVFLASATMQRSGTTYTVTPVGDARGVWFYVDGIPTTWDYDAPYQSTIASGTVTARAYALYAQLYPVVAATDLGESGSMPYRNGGRATRSAGVIP